jgi:ribonuclease HII
LLPPLRRALCALTPSVAQQIEWAACVIEHTVIDDINILQATMRAMEGAVASLPRGAPDRVLVDGNRVPPALSSNGEFLIRGDDKSYAIGAASIIAKVTRDRLMLALDVRFPQYGFAQHKGYGTKAHMDAIAKHGPCDVHRRTFAPMKHMV